MQSKSTFPARIAPFSVLEPLPFSRVGLNGLHGRPQPILQSLQMEWTTLENRERSCSAVAVQKHTS